MSFVWQIIGPLGLLAACVLGAYLPLAVTLDFFFSAVIGLYLCAKWQIRGCHYAIGLLVLIGAIMHIFFESHHLLRLALEASFASSLIVTGFVFADCSQIEIVASSRTSLIENLEEEIAMLRASSIDAQMALEKKLEEVRKNFDDLSSEKSTLEILNDVIRKANATSLKEKEALQEQIQELQEALEGLDWLFSDMHIEFECLEEEIESLKGENRQLQEMVGHWIEKESVSIAVHRTPLPRGASLRETLRETLIPKKGSKKSKNLVADLGN